MQRGVAIALLLLAGLAVAAHASAESSESFHRGHSNVVKKQPYWATDFSFHKGYYPSDWTFHILSFAKSWHSIYNNRAYDIYGYSFGNEYNHLYRQYSESAGGILYFYSQEGSYAFWNAFYSSPQYLKLGFASPKSDHFYTKTYLTYDPYVQYKF